MHFWMMSVPKQPGLKLKSANTSNGDVFSKGCTFVLFVDGCLHVRLRFLELSYVLCFQSVVGFVYSSMF